MDNREIIREYLKKTYKSNAFRIYLVECVGIYNKILDYYIIDSFLTYLEDGSVYVGWDKTFFLTFLNYDSIKMYSDTHIFYLWKDSP